jgi:predicted PurR-regulated permease PerM
MKRLAWFTLVVLTTLTIVLLIWEFRATVVLFVLSLAAVATLRPIMDRLKTAGIRPELALLMTYVACVGTILALIWILSGPFLSDLQQLASDLAGRLDQIRTQGSHGNLFQQFIAQLLPAGSPSAIDPASNDWLQTFLGMALSSLDLLGQLIIILVLSLYWNLDQERFKRLWLSLLPSETRTRVRDVWQAIETGVGAYIRSELIQSVLAVILLGGGYYVLGLKYPVALGVIGAIGWLIPWVGVLLAVVPALFVGLAMSPMLGLVAALMTLAILSLLEFVVEPASSIAGASVRCW